MFFKCKHPFRSLIIQKESTTKNIDRDFEEITHHLLCRKCNTKLDLSYAEMIGGLEGYYGRAGIDYKEGRFNFNKGVRNGKQ